MKQRSDLGYDTYICLEGLSKITASPRIHVSQSAARNLSLAPPELTLTFES